MAPQRAAWRSRSPTTSSCRSATWASEKASTISCRSPRPTTSTRSSKRNGDVSERALMQRALRLAERGRGQTPPNPMVGAVLVDDDGVVVGDGYHQRAGLPHAEVRALEAAGARARGTTLYCTLEPCCHT